MANIYEEDLWYTRLRFDRNGNIVEADFLEEDDLPAHEHSIADFGENFKGDLTSIIKEVVSTMFVNNTQKAVKFIYDKEKGLFSADVRYDEVTIDKNEYGELIALGGGESGSSGVIISGECATHTHTSDQIEDFEEAVKKVIGDRKLNGGDLAHLVDNTTIYVNSNGVLSASSGGTSKSHTHSIKEIVDFPVILPAALQPLEDLGEDVDYTGAIDLSDLTIGYSILTINKWLGTVLESKLENLQNQINQLKKDSASGLQLNLYVSDNVQSNFLLDTKTNKIVEVYRGSQFEVILDYLPYNTGLMNLYVDGKVIAKANVADLNAIYKTSGIFTVSKITTKGLTAAKSITIPLKNLTEGTHSIYLEFIPDETRENTSNILTVAITDKDALPIAVQDINETVEVLGTKYYTENFKGAWKAYIVDYNKVRYVNQNVFDGKGEAYFTAPYPETRKDGRTVPNLFGFTKLNIEFPYELNINDCELVKLLTGPIDLVNNKVVGKGEEKVVSLLLPNSRLFNSIRIKGLEFAEAEVRKGSTFTNQKVYEDGYVLSFLNNYHDQKSDMVLTIKSKSEIDLSKISYELLDLSIR